MTTESTSSSNNGCYTGCGCAGWVVVLVALFIAYMNFTGGKIYQSRDCHVVRIPPIVNLDTCYQAPTPTTPSTPSF